MESSETIRQALPLTDLGGAKIESELHGDMQRPAETCGPAAKAERNTTERSSLSGK